MGKENGLGTLQVGVARENHFFIGFRLQNHGFQHRLYEGRNLVDFLPQVHPQVESHLIVSASGGVELLAHVAQPLGQHLLHEHVDILAAHIEFQCAGIQIV